MNGKIPVLSVLFALAVAGCRVEEHPARTTGDSTAPRDSASAPAGDVAAAVVVVRAYYDAIRARDYGRAYRLWADSGRASGKSLPAFTLGFAETAATDVTIGTPGRVEGAAGSRYVDIPVDVAARRRDGSVQHFRGSYSLRRAVVTGASPEQRRWHLSSARLEPTP